MSPTPRLRVVSAESEVDSPVTADPAGEVDFRTLLSAWQSATDRLQQTHETLRDEVKRLTDELEVKNRELARKNRLADLGQMAAHVAHEVRNSLVPLTLYLSLLRRRLGHDAGSLDIVTKLSRGVTGLEATVAGLLSFTTDRAPVRQWIAVREMVAEIVESLAPQLEAQHIRWVLDIDAGESVAADGEMFRRAVVNLVLNSIDAMPGGGELVITSYNGASGFELEVADSGAGLAEGDLDRIFDPFFTTKHEGTGLGLAIVQRIAEAHGASVRAANCPEGGAAFTLTFPRLALERAA
jgi:signal transduction histidine kinase